MNFPKTKAILASWLDHAQRNSGHGCDEDYEQAMDELNEADREVDRLTELYEDACGGR